MTLTGRYDGSSILADGNKWAFFPSAAFAWRIINEPFLNAQKTVSDLKLRLSYGETGNNGTGGGLAPLGSQSLVGSGFTTIGDQVVETNYITNLANQNLTWEKTKEKARLSGNNLDILEKFAERDSILLSKRIISVAEFETNKMNQLNAVFSDVTTRNEASQIMLEIFTTQNAINETEIKKEEIEKALYLALSSTFHELSASLKQFDETYVFRSPQEGNLQYLNFWNNNYFVQAGEQVFSIVPSNNKIVAQVLLPNAGAGKVEIGQEVIIKLDNYPFNEFGSLRGTVRDISLVTNTQKTEQGEIESYLVHVTLPEELITNYGSKLAFKYELKGIAEIVTKKRMLIERAFDNIKYMLSEKGTTK